jgi:hypothetical protein
MSEREEKWDVVRGTDKFTALKVPRHCPLVLLLKIRSKEDKTFGCGGGRVMKCGITREIEQCLTVFDHNFEFW